MFRFIIVLALVCIVAAVILGSTYTITKPLIAAQKEKEIGQALQDVVPGAVAYDKKSFSKGDYYECKKDKKIIGYALFATASGYSGDIKMVVGIDQKGRITGLEVLSQTETPGLGARCEEVLRGEKTPWFLQQFKGKDAADLSLKNIQAITGATITSRAIIEGIKEYVQLFLKEVD